MNYFKQITSFIRSSSNKSAVTSQVMGADNYINASDSSKIIKNMVIPFNLPDNLDKNILAEQLLNDLLKRLFTDAIALVQLSGITKELIDEGVLFERFIDFMKSDKEYNLYTKKNNSGDIYIIVCNEVKDLELDKVVIYPSSHRYYSMLSMFEVLANYIIATYKNTEISNFFVFKKDGYNQLFNLNETNISSEAMEYQDSKNAYFQKQLNNLEESLTSQGKESIVLIDSKDELALMEVKYENIERNLDNIYKLISLSSGLPDSYLTGTFKSSLGGSHSGEIQATRNAILSFLKAELLPFLRMLGVALMDSNISILERIRTNIDIISVLSEEQKAELFNDAFLDIKNEIKGVNND